MPNERHWRIAKAGTVPPGGAWRYVDPDDGERISHPYYDQVLVRATKHRKSHGHSLPFDWREQFDQNICEHTPGGCVQLPGPPQETKKSLLGLAAQFAVHMAQWVVAGAHVCEYEEFRRRYLICGGEVDTPRCAHFSQFPAFGLTKCSKCGCSCGVKLRLASEHCPIGRW